MVNASKNKNNTEDHIINSMLNKLDNAKQEKTTKPSNPPSNPTNALQETIKGILGELADVKVEIGDVSKVILTPSNKYASCYASMRPYIFEFRPTKSEQETLKSSTKSRLSNTIASIVVDRFVADRMKPTLASGFGIDKLARMIGRDRANKLFAYMCKQGSVLHCSELYESLDHLIKQIIHDPTVKEYFISYIRSAGFPVLADFLSKVDIQRLPAHMRSSASDAIISSIMRDIRSIFEQYSMIGKPADIPDSEIKRSKEIIYKNCDLDVYFIEDVVFDESLIMDTIEKVKKYYPECVVEAQPEPPKTPLETIPNISIPLERAISEIEINELRETVSKEELAEMLKKLKEYANKYLNI